ncbi:uncharacterized protein E0L32_004590 [Thyridium curvatum]|uniref:Uncharacterized protein n=1 Tax=Thyridium curvatum TaxID=1093900 RepID=A0A507B683_9PEZI|nr:uncharacterized protein E0L32_004590 [Thyridium curvatum]TPX15313.1 hypothetical protein E0L32_004590 [Thyridium curvatum]
MLTTLRTTVRLTARTVLVAMASLWLVLFLWTACLAYFIGKSKTISRLAGRLFAHGIDRQYQLILVSDYHAMLSLVLPLAQSLVTGRSRVREQNGQQIDRPSLVALYGMLTGRFIEMQMLARDPVECGVACKSEHQE